MNGRINPFIHSTQQTHMVANAGERGHSLQATLDFFPRASQAAVFVIGTVTE